MLGKNVMSIEVVNQNVAVKSFERDGKKFKFREQEAWASLVGQDGTPDRYPTKISMSLDEDQNPYAVGKYELSLRSFLVAGYGRMTVGRVKLDPVQVQDRKVA